MLIPVAGLEGGAEGGPEDSPPSGDPLPSERVPAVNSDEYDSSAGVIPGSAAAEETLRVGEGGVEEKVGWEILIGGVVNAWGLTGGV